MPDPERRRAERARFVEDMQRIWTRAEGLAR
jgi:hypothetical protein